MSIRKEWTRLNVEYTKLANEGKDTEHLQPRFRELLMIYCGFLEALDQTEWLQEDLEFIKYCVVRPFNALLHDRTVMGLVSFTTLPRY